MDQSNPSWLVLGGCRSGKSAYAQRLAEKTDLRRVFVATCVPGDPEMHARVQAHKAVRDNTWLTVEAPVDIAAAIEDHPTAGVILVDCLTLWVTNCLMAGMTPKAIASHADALAKLISGRPCPVILVSNEVGMGIVPENALARMFRDIAGLVNQSIALSADHVVLMAAGIPLHLKGGRHE